MKPSENESKPEGSAQATPPVAGSAVASGSRRRLLRGGLAAAPALLALKTTPVMACNCKVPSGFSTSGNLSHNQGKTCTAPGTKPSGWRGQCDSTSPNYYWYTNKSCKQGDMFTTCFTKTNGTYPNKSLSTCLNYADTHPQALAVACYLQAIGSGGSAFPTTTQIKAIWDNGICGTGYVVNGTTTWSSAQCISYLKYLTGQ